MKALGHKASGVRVATAIGPAWQARCTCGFAGRTYWLKGAMDAAREEAARHIDEILWPRADTFVHDHS